MAFLKKLLVLGILAAVLLGFAAYDYLRAQDTAIEVVSIAPERVEADPNKPVLITLRVTTHGELAVGDTVSALVKGQGNLSGDKIKVGEDGTVTFKYYPYTIIPGVFEEGDVEIEFRNISDSVFIAIQKRERIVFHVYEPEEESGGMNMGDLFGE
ncbi:MAG: hypothetical protein E7436_03910 [Ruminococcaceae bacterium]|nr:hypothetical protein [Oscillospiraceae bacterium]